MAIGTCRECGKEVSSEAKICPHCGVKQPIRKSNTGCLVALGVLVLLFVIGSLTSHNTTAPVTSTTTSIATSTETAQSDQVVTPPNAPQTPWVYDDSTDEMRGTPIHIACTATTNEVSLDFPYGNQHAYLCVRQHPRFGEDVYVRLENEGQFLCNSYSGCNVRVRFDDGAVSTFSANEASDNSTNVIFITGHSRFIQSLKRSSRVFVEAEFYQAGVQQMSFETSGLVWPRSAAH